MPTGQQFCRRIDIFMTSATKPKLDDTKHGFKNYPISDNDKFLTFALNNEEYGIEILKVREIIGMPAATPVPQAPDHLKGVINLRGKVIPVVDLRLVFGMSEKKHDKESCVIILNIDNALAGVVVDAVSEVITSKSEDFSQVANAGNNYKAQYIQGLLNINKKIIILLDIDNIFMNKSQSF